MIYGSRDRILFRIITELFTFALAFARLDDLFLLIPNSARSEGRFAARKALPRCLGDGGLVPA